MTDAQPRYVLHKAILKEIKDNPLRSLLNLIQTGTILAAAFVYLQSAADPPKTFLRLPGILLQPNEAGKFTGGMQIVSEGEAPIRDVNGYAIGVTENDNLVNEQLVKLRGPISMMGNSLTLTFDKPPEFIIFCLTVRNEKGAIVHQRLVLRQDQSAQSRQFAGTVAGFWQVPEPEAPPDPACRF